MHLGSGKIHWDGWVSVDLDEKADIQCDLRKLPFDDNCADAACSVHVIEHFYEWEARDVLKEWHRVLKPGGKLILELPCMDKVVHYLIDMVTRGLPLSPAFCWFAFWGDPKYRSVEMCHKWGYTYLMLKQVLSDSGFVDIKADKARYHFPNRDMRVVSYKPSTT